MVMVAYPDNPFGGEVVSEIADLMSKDERYGLNPDPPKNALRMDPDKPGSVSLTYGPDPEGKRLHVTRGCASFPLDKHGRHKPLEHPFPDVGGLYGYCPACHEPQGDTSHAWVHTCNDRCLKYYITGAPGGGELRTCVLQGRAVFMCQRKMLPGELLNAILTEQG